jgi:5'-methylthioinosine phosphorylase
VKVLGIIGGTGLAHLEGVEHVRTHQIDTPYGSTSREIEEARLHGEDIFYLHRHGAPQQIAPHDINYRANLWALHSLGVSHIIGFNAVGGIHPKMQTGALVLPDQLIDYTWGREHTIAGTDGAGLQHIDFTQPYDHGLRKSLQRAANAVNIALCGSAVHGVTQGPRLETAAEIRRLERDGCDVVGMTGMPEAAVARELGIAYACVCMVVNCAAGKGAQPLSMSDIRNALTAHTVVVDTLLGQFLSEPF